MSEQMVRRKVVQQQNMTQQPQSLNQSQTQTAPASRGSFPWFRLLCAVGIGLLLAFLSLFVILGTGRVISPIWVIVAPVLIALIVAIIPVVQYFFPLSPVAWRFSKTSQASSPTPDPPLTPPVSPVLPTSPTPQPQQPSVSSSQAPVAPTTQPVLTASTVQESQIFHCNEPQLPNHEAFYNRVYERSELIQRVSIRASTAVDGEYRIGKSWLLQYLQQVAPTHPQLGSHVRVGRFSATHPHCQTPSGFVKYVLEKLNLPNHSNGHAQNMPLAQLAKAARDCQQLGIIPVLCIDEFAGLIGKPGFDITFLSELRSIAEDDGLVLITASKQPLHEIIEQMTGQTSPLFNIMPRLPLKPFTEAEARKFILEKGQQAFDQKESDFFRACAAIFAPDGTMGWPPLRLQLVGKMLLNDKRAALAESRTYNVSDATYQAAFKQRLDEQYKAMVKS